MDQHVLGQVGLPVELLVAQVAAKLRHFLVHLGHVLLQILELGKRAIALDAHELLAADDAIVHRFHVRVEQLL